MKRTVTRPLDQLWLATDRFTERHDKAILALVFSVSVLLTLAKDRLGVSWYYALTAGWAIAVLVFLSVVRTLATRVRRRDRNRS
jgi:multidrug transporter EmrE-like cation transporter